MAEAAKVKAIVAKGKTVEGDHPTKKVNVLAPDGKTMIERPDRCTFPENSEIELPADVVADLRARGFLVDPTQVVEATSTAPGARITEK